MQLGDRRAEQARGFVEGLPHPGNRLIGARTDVVEILPGGEDILQFAVMQVLRKHLALAPFEADQLGQKVRAVPDQAVDRKHPGPGA